MKVNYQDFWVSCSHCNWKGMLSECVRSFTKYTSEFDQTIRLFCPEQQCQTPIANIVMRKGL